MIGKDPQANRLDVATRRLRWGVAMMCVVAAVVSGASVRIAMHWPTCVQSALPPAVPYPELRSVPKVIELDFEVNRPGIESPPWASVHDERIADALCVIGLVVHGEAYAYSLRALTIPTRLGAALDIGELSRRHVVNHLLGSTAVSVTYCEVSMRVRVFKKEPHSRALPLGIAGSCNGRLVLLLAGQQYMQDSPNIPLDDAPYEITTWRDWVSRHPTSRIYLGGP